MIKINDLYNLICYKELNKLTIELSNLLSKIIKCLNDNKIKDEDMELFNNSSLDLEYILNTINEKLANKYNKSLNIRLVDLTIDDILML